MITIDSLTVRAGGRTILDRLTMHLTEGAVHGIVGVGGAGKSALLHTLYGFMPAAAGSVTRGGRPLRRRDTAYLESAPFFYEGMTAGDYLDLIARYHPSADPEPYVRLFDLPLGEEPSGWPADRKKKLALAGVLMQRKETVLLDAPFSGLDTESLPAVRRLIAMIAREGRTALVTSPALAPLENLADDLYLLDGGRIAARYEREEFARAVRETEILFRRRYDEMFSDGDGR